MTDVAGRLSNLAKILKAVASAAIFGVVIFYCVVLAWKALLWALPDMPWTNHAAKTHVEASAAPPLASANTTAAAVEPIEPDESVAPQATAIAGTARSRELGPTPLPAPVTTAAPDPASKLGMGDLWLNVCGNSRTGYRMCRGSTPTDAQRAANFPPGAKDL